MENRISQTAMRWRGMGGGSHNRKGICGGGRGVDHHQWANRKARVRKDHLLHRSNWLIKLLWAVFDAVNLKAGAWLVDVVGGSCAAGYIELMDEAERLTLTVAGLVGCINANCSWLACLFGRINRRREGFIEFAKGPFTSVRMRSW
ncbi:hypothetical protein CEXT_222771 [Caerostris extrusa]|uniref:Uncharacterized protein n=1 Tax=Caerostris extrusa TaxID=172846 RepID=A0AAV4NMN7_CAEEX|nr:hypothetical protein CEXT_222771 [Caerostris extrusa]